MIQERYSSASNWPELPRPYFQFVVFSMDISELKSLSDDDLREQLEENGYAPPPITDDAVRELLRRKLFKLINPDAEYPENEASEGSSDEEDKDGDVDVHLRHNFGAGDAAPTTNRLNIHTKKVEEQQHRSKFPIVVAVGFVILNILLAATIFYRDLLF
ncbi:hypothetical protein ECG_07484 [Echinococcus granulosus]|nr:hypothetical protein ECG_07484 [Echinococcus granulosus]